MKTYVIILSINDFKLCGWTFQVATHGMLSWLWICIYEFFLYGYCCEILNEDSISLVNEIFFEKYFVKF